MNKKIKVIINMIILVAILGNQLCFANVNASDDNSFMEVNKIEISPNETLEMSMNLSKIEYDKFKILLNSNINTDEIYIEEDADVTVDSDSNVISVEIDKTKMSINELKLYYVIPENIEIGSVIQLLAQVVTSVEVIIEEDDSAVEENDETEKKENIIVEEQVVLEEMKEITIIEKSEDLENDDGENNEEDSEFPSQDNNEEQNQPNLEDNQDVSNDITQGNDFDMQNSANQSTDFAGMQSSTTSNMNFTTIIYSENSAPSNEVETVTYNGLSNNYLSSLQIEGVELNTTFNKENRNYFVEIKDQTSLDVTAVAEDENAKVVITGEDNITSSESKILISVTAENGDIRYYRIFVTVAEEEDNET